MGITVEHVTAFLMSAELYGGIYRKAYENYLGQWEAATKTTAQMTGMPGGGGREKSDVYASVIDAKSDIRKWLEPLQARRELISSFLLEVEIDEYKKYILQMRYLMKMKWSEIAVKINAVKPMSDRQLYRVHNTALQECADWVNETGKYRKEILS